MTDSRKLGWAAFAVIATLFIAIQASHARYSVSDENTYFKMGEAISKGETPYRDFFYAHPPMQAYLYAIVFKIFGFNFLILKLASTIATVITAMIIFRLLLEKSQTAAVAGSSIFLFSYSTMLFTNLPTGTAITTMLATTGYYLFTKGKYTLSGAMLAIAALTGLLALIAAAITAGFLLLKKFSSFKKFAAGFIAIFLTVNVIFTIISGGSYLQDTYTYHFLKPADTTDKTDVMWRMAKTNALLFGAALTIILAGNKLRQNIAIPATTAIAYIGYAIISKTGFNYYTFPAFPFLALLGATGAEELARKTKIRKIAVITAIAAIILTSTYFSYRSFAAYDYQNFTEAEEIAAYIKEHTTASETIFGDDSTTPLISLLSGREIALNFIDSNNLRFRTGLTDTAETIQKLKTETNLKYFIIRKIETNRGALIYGVGFITEFRQFLSESCKIEKTFSTEWNGLTRKYEIYDCG
ncbi:glycosyltransferase family 39 protein [Candidatus Woesearchaeota archaeon]|nr:glycosyltransferase family 39 protein [Candidatus Woesearchaeota archaeon]